MLKLASVSLEVCELRHNIAVIARMEGWKVRYEKRHENISQAIISKKETTNKPTSVINIVSTVATVTPSQPGIDFILQVTMSCQKLLIS